MQVIGVPDKQYGEEIMACVILKPGETMPRRRKSSEFVATHMAKHKTPRYVAFVDAFPMNAAGKILKYKMREQAVEMLNLQADNSHRNRVISHSGGWGCIDIPGRCAIIPLTDE